jgi:crossover junction endodeoxyribonuclease RuvC
MIYIGIDPGQAGGIAIIHKGDNNERNGSLNVISMPLAGKDIDVAALSIWLYDQVDGICTDTPVAYLEKVSAMPKQGVASTFKFGINYGIIIGILGTIQIPYYLVTPQAWKKEVLAGLDWKGNKLAAVDYCRRAYPDISLLATSRSYKPHSGMADALCMAVYASIKHAK